MVFHPAKMKPERNKRSERRDCKVVHEYLVLRFAIAFGCARKYVDNDPRQQRAEEQGIIDKR